MSEFLLQTGVSNLCVGLALALVAWGVQRWGRRPVIAHVLWVLVLLKLLTPPVFNLPLLPLPLPSQPTATTAADDAPLAAIAPAVSALVDTAAVDHQPVAGMQLSTLLVGLWILGSCGVLVFSGLRIYRFHRLLGECSERAAPRLQEQARQVAQDLGLQSTPETRTVSAQVLPMVWWVGGPVQVIIPASLPFEMEPDEFRWILAHELAHVRRCDHMVRWLEWLVGIVLWWNPLAWWARRNLRASEEICCDALVLSSLHPDPHSYASSLLNAVELISAPTLHAPALASAVNSGGFLEKRLKMIVSQTPLRVTSRRLLVGVILSAAAVLPIGVAYAQTPDTLAVAERLLEAVEAGELTREQANIMLNALHGTAKDQDERQRRAKFTRDEYERAAKRIKAGVEAGEISQEHAATRLEEMRRALARGDGDHSRAKHEKRRAEYERAEKEIMAGVRAGKIKEEHARIRLEEMRRALSDEAENQDHDKQDPDAIKLRKRLGAAVEAGELTREEAVAKWKSIMGDDRKGLRDPHGDRAITQQEYDRAEREIKGAVEAGTVSREDAGKRLEAMRKRINSSKGAEQKNEIKEIEAMRQRLIDAVKAGKITEEEARAKLHGLMKEAEKRRQMEMQRDRDQRDRDQRDRDQHDHQKNREHRREHDEMADHENNREHRGEHDEMADRSMQDLRHRLASAGKAGQGRLAERGRGEGRTARARSGARGQEGAARSGRAGP